MSEVDALTAGVAAYTRPEPLDAANEVLARAESANPALLLRDAEATLRELTASALSTKANPTAEQAAAMEQLQALVARLKSPPAEASAQPKTWEATGAAKSHAVTAPAQPRPKAAPADPAVAKLVAELKTAADLDGAVSLAGLKTAGMPSDQLATHGEAVQASLERISGALSELPASNSGQIVALKNQLQSAKTQLEKKLTLLPKPTPPVITLAKDSSPQEVAAQIYGVPKAGAAHVAMLKATNPELAAKIDKGEKLTAGTPVRAVTAKSVGDSIAKTDTALRQLEASAVDGRASAAPQGAQALALAEGKKALLAQRKTLEGAQGDLTRREAVASLEVASTPAEVSKALSTVMKGASPFDAAQQEVSQLQKLVGRKLNPASGEVDPKGAMAALTAAKSTLDKTLAGPGATSFSAVDRAALYAARAEVGQQTMAVQAYLNPTGATKANVVGELKSLGQTAAMVDADLKLAQAALKPAPTDDPRAQAVREALTGLGKQAGPSKLSHLSSALAASAGDTTQAVSYKERELATKLGLPENAFSAKTEMGITDEGKNAAFYQYFSSKTVKALSPAQVQQAVSSIDKMEPAAKAEALKALTEFSALAGDSRDLSALHVGQQLMGAVGAKDKAWEAEAGLSKGAYLVQLGNPEAAHKQFQAAEASALAIKDPVAQKDALRKALFGQATSLEAGCAGDDAPKAKASAGALTALRRRMETSLAPGSKTEKLFDSKEVATVMLREANALVRPDPKGANATLAELKTKYGKELPALSKKLDEFEKTNRTGSAEAFFKTVLNEGAKGTSKANTALVVGSATVLSAAVVGAQAGVLGGPLGVLVGAVVGAGVGALGGLAANAVASMSHSAFEGTAMDAANAQLTNLTWKETALNAATVAADIAGGGVLGAIGKKVGAAGLEAALKGGTGKLSEDAVAVLGSRQAQLAEKMGTAKWSALSKESQAALASKSFQKEALAAGLNVGALPQAVVMGGQMTSMVKQWYDIENDPSLTEAERGQKREEMRGGLAMMGMALAGMGVGASVAGKAMMRGTTAEGRKAMGSVLSARSSVKVLDDQKFAAEVDGLAKLHSEMSGTKAGGQEARYAHLKAEKEAFFDPVSGNVVVHADVIKQGRLNDVLAHELTHRSMGQLPVSGWKAMAEALKKDGSFEGIKKTVLEANPHLAQAGDVATLERQILDEHFAMRAADPAAKPLSAGASAVLKQHGIREVKAADVKKLADQVTSGGTASLGATRVHRGGETHGVGHSEAAGIDGLKALSQEFAPLRGLLSAAQSMPAIKAKAALIKTDRVKELQLATLKEPAKAREWNDVLTTGMPPDKSAKLMSALQSDTPDALQALLNPAGQGPAAAPPLRTPAAAPPAAPAARPATAAPAAKPPTSQVAAPSPAVTAASADIEALGGYTASELRAVLKKSPEQAAEIAAFAKALKDPFGGITVNRTQLAEAFAKADPAGREAMTETLTAATSTKASIKGLTSGQSAFNDALELALKPPAQGAASVRQLGAIAGDLQSVKLDSTAKDSIVKAMKTAAVKGDTAALGHLAKNLEALKDPTVAARMTELARVGNVSGQLGELLSQASPEKVMALRSLANRTSNGAGSDFDLAVLAKKAVRDEKMAKFLSEDASPELLAAMASAKAPGKTALEKLVLDASIHEKGSEAVLRAANNHTGDKLETFASNYADTASRANQDLNTPALRAAYAEYRTDMGARPPSTAAPEALKLGIEAKVNQGPSEWKLGQRANEGAVIADALKARQDAVSFSANRLGAKLNTLSDTLRTNDPKRVEAALVEVYKELVQLNGEAAVSNRAAVNPQLVEQLRQLEVQIATIRKPPATGAQQMAAIKALAQVS